RDRGAQLRAVPRLRPARHLPPQGGEREGPDATGGELVHRRLRGGAGGVYLPGRRGAAGLAAARPAYRVPPVSSGNTCCSTSGPTATGPAKGRVCAAMSSSARPTALAKRPSASAAVD